MIENRKDALMKTKERKPRKKSRHSRAKNKATKTFYAKLQKAVDEVDWGKVELPRGRC
jgi:hypothetical protein